jgi:hypothetical protein
VAGALGFRAARFVFLTGILVAFRDVNVAVDLARRVRKAALGIKQSLSAVCRYMVTGWGVMDVPPPGNERET